MLFDCAVILLMMNPLPFYLPTTVHAVRQKWSTPTKAGNMVAVMDIPKSATGSYGIVTPRDDNGRSWIYQLWLKSPSLPDAPSTIGVVGRYIIEPGVFNQLGVQDRGASNEVQLTDALARQIGKVPFKGLRFSVNDLTVDQKLGFCRILPLPCLVTI